MLFIISMCPAPLFLSVLVSHSPSLTQSLFSYRKTYECVCVDAYAYIDCESLFVTIRFVVFSHFQHFTTYIISWFLFAFAW